MRVSVHHMQNTFPRAHLPSFFASSRIPHVVCIMCTYIFSRALDRVGKYAVVHYLALRAIYAAEIY